MACTDQIHTIESPNYNLNFSSRNGKFEAPLPPPSSFLPLHGCATEHIYSKVLYSEPFVSINNPPFPPHSCFYFLEFCRASFPRISLHNASCPAVVSKIFNVSSLTDIGFSWGYADVLHATHLTESLIVKVGLWLHISSIESSTPEVLMIVLLCRGAIMQKVKKWKDFGSKYFLVFCSGHRKLGLNLWEFSF